MRDFSLPTLALEWQAMFLDLLERKKTHPLVPYHPTRPYRATDPAPASPVKLNIACGPNIFPHDGWTNYDKVVDERYWAFMATGERHEMPASQRALAKWMKGRDCPVIRRDMLERFPHEDGSVDYIYVGQAIEHLNRRTQAVPFLKECWRMLKPGGVLRMTTPDLEMLLDAAKGCSFADFAKDQPDWFKDAPWPDQFAYLAFGAAGPGCSQSNYEGHMHLYTKQTLFWTLREAGFGGDIKVNTTPHHEVTDEGMSHSFSVDATK